MKPSSSSALLAILVCGSAVLGAALGVPSGAAAQDAPQDPPADVGALASEPLETRQTLLEMVKFTEEKGLPDGQSLITIKAQILLDRANASPGVIDGYGGENVAKAVRTFEEMEGLQVDGILDDEVWAALEPSSEPTTQIYTITEKDLDRSFVNLPDDYAKLAELEWLGYVTPAEMFAERFHMDVELIEALNPEADFGRVGERLLVAQPEGEHPTAKVTRITADRERATVSAYDSEGNLVTAYPATIGSRDNPSPSGTHEVEAVAIEPAYYYNPEENFQQGDNDEKLKIPPGPNNPVGLVWIDLSKETYGIHGTPEPAEIDKTFSHGCVRLTNWDAKELSELVEVGATVEFL